MIRYFLRKRCLTSSEWNWLLREKLESGKSVRRSVRRDWDQRQAGLTWRVRLGTEEVHLGDIEDGELRGLMERPLGEPGWTVEPSLP